MKKLYAILLTLALSAALASAQTTSKKKSMPEGSPQEEKAERSVHITSGPTVSNVTKNSATIVWTTNKNAATDIHYGYGGGHMKVAYDRGGSKNHSITLSNLKPGTTYTYRIMTREKEVRTSGQFTTPAS
jgi:1,4-alpha-glucan branching enzyme